MFGFFGLVFHHLPQTFLCLINVFSGARREISSIVPCFLIFHFFLNKSVLQYFKAEKIRDILAVPLLPKWCSATSLREDIKISSSSF